MGRPRVTIDAAVFATAVGIDARGEADVRAVVARDDRFGQVAVELRWRPGLFLLLARLAVRPLQLAVGLGQIGEFSFVLASAGLAAGAIDDVLYVGLIASVAVSISVSSVVVRYVPIPSIAVPAAAD